MQTEKRKPGPAPKYSEPLVKTSVMLRADQVERAKLQPEGMSALIRDCIDRALATLESEH